MLKRPFWRKIRKETQQQQELRLKQRREIENYNWKLSETAPSCNDCVATIITEPFTPTVKGVGTVSLAFRKIKNKSVISPDSGIRRGLET